ncbi:MAG TPA: Gfo/Idh/MocA family oxidoreductase [Segetibacter sp.]
MVINWGIIGCGDVTEVKSGPAFNKVPNSKLVAVMRRDKEKVQDYAQRHNVPKWYTDAYALINDPDVTAIYVATPPLQHEEYTIAALNAGKPVYVEKPMAVDAAAAQRMTDAVKPESKLSVAHYRRAQPVFLKIKELLAAKEIGEVKFVDMKFFKASVTPEQLQKPGVQWRVNQSIAGGGLFHDLAPHQLDIMYYLFGKVKGASGASANQGRLYDADDIVAGNLLFESGVIFQGLWCFSVPKEEEKDTCEIIGSTGKMSFSIFGDPKITLTQNGKEQIIQFEKLEHVQQPMIEKVVKYFLGDGENPSSAEDGVIVMKLLDAFTSNLDFDNDFY